MLPWKQRKRHILPVSQNLLSVYFSLAKFQLVSCNLSLAMIWQRTYTHKLPKLCSATLKYNFFRIKKCDVTEKGICEIMKLVGWNIQKKEDKNASLLKISLVVRSSTVMLGRHHITPSKIDLDRNSLDQFMFVLLRVITPTAVWIFWNYKNTTSNNTCPVNFSLRKQPTVTRRHLRFPRQTTSEKRAQKLGDLWRHCGGLG